MRRLHAGQNWLTKVKCLNVTADIGILIVVVDVTRTGPNIYMPDPMLGDTVRSTKPKAPSFSMGGKATQLSSDAVLFKTTCWLLCQIISISIYVYVCTFRLRPTSSTQVLSCDSWTAIRFGKRPTFSFLTFIHICDFHQFAPPTPGNSWTAKSTRKKWNIEANPDDGRQLLDFVSYKAVNVKA